MAAKLYLINYFSNKAYYFVVSGGYDTDTSLEGRCETNTYDRNL